MRGGYNFNLHPSYNKTKNTKSKSRSNKKLKGGKRKTRKSRTNRRRKIRGGGMIGTLMGNFDANGGSLNQVGTIAQTPALYNSLTGSY